MPLASRSESRALLMAKARLPYLTATCSVAACTSRTVKPSRSRNSRRRCPPAATRLFSSVSTKYWWSVSRSFIPLFRTRTLSARPVPASAPDKRFGVPQPRTVWQSLCDHHDDRGGTTPLPPNISRFELLQLLKTALGTPFHVSLSAETDR